MAQPEQATFVQASVLLDRCVFVKLTLEALGNSRKISSSNVEVDADKTQIKVSKVLLDSLELEAIRTLDGEIRRYLYGLCLPFEPGVHLLPLELVERAEERLAEYQTRRAALVDSFIVAYPRLTQDAARRLRAVYDPRDYPSADDARRAFRMRWQYITIAAPDRLREANPTLFQQERDKIAARMEEAFDEVRQTLRAGLLELVTHLQERLEPGSDGKPKRLAQTTVDKLRDWLALFEWRNVTDDAELSALVAELKAMNGDLNAEALRDSGNLRARVKDAMNEAASRLEVLTGGRKINTADLPD